jgi:hypothetical protein
MFWFYSFFETPAARAGGGNGNAFRCDLLFRYNI